MSELRAVDPSGLAAAIAPFPQGLRAGDTLYISGQIALDQANELVGEGDVAAQTRQIVDRIGSILAECGAGLDRVVTTTVFLKSADLFASFNTAWAEAFGEHRPARATVVTDFVVPGALIEVQAIAQLSATDARG